MLCQSRAPRAGAFLIALSAAAPLGCSDGDLQAFSASPIASAGASSGGTPSSGGSGGTVTASGGRATNSGGASGAMQSGGSTASGGTSSSGGSSGEGGTSGGVAGSSSAGDFDLLDDFEDGDIRPIQGDGWWYTTGDPRKPSFEVTQSSEGTQAFHAWDYDVGSYGFAGLDVPGWEYDASRYTELRFRARIEASSAREMRVKLLGTNAEVWAGVTLSTQWQEYSLPFSAFKPKEGTMDVLDPSSIAHVQFFMLDVKVLDFWLDDVAFVKQ